MGKFDKLGGISAFVIIPGDNLDEGIVELDSCLGIEGGDDGCADEVRGNDLVLSVSKDALQHILVEGLFQLRFVAAAETGARFLSPICCSFELIGRRLCCHGKRCSNGLAIEQIALEQPHIMTVATSARGGKLTRFAWPQ